MGLECYTIISSINILLFLNVCSSDIHSMNEYSEQNIVITGINGNPFNFLSLFDVVMQQREFFLDWLCFLFPVVAADV